MILDRSLRVGMPRSGASFKNRFEEKTVGAAGRSRSLWFLKHILNLAFAPIR